MDRRSRPPRRIAGAAAALALGCLVPSAVAAPIGGAPPPVLETESTAGELAAAYQPGEAIVRFERGTSGPQRRAARRGAGVDYESSLDLPRTQVVEVEGSVPAAVRRLERQPGVEFAQPNYRYEALAEPPDDTFFDELWGLSAPPAFGVNALAAWDTALGSGEVIAVVDTGVDLTHPDLEPNLWSNPEEAIGAEDGDGNGKEDDVHGYDFVDEDGDPDEYHFHGTHVAGTVAAVAENELGIAGVAPAAEIMAVRVLDGDGFGFSEEIAEGIEYAAKEGAGTINLSLGGPAGSGDELVEGAVEVAADHGTVVVAAAGNENGADNDDPEEATTPCALPQENLICVAAVTQGGGLAGFSNYGATTVDLGAPGVGILSARVDYGGPKFEEGFESGIDPWTTREFNGGVAWGTSGSPAIGALSATDSPGSNYGQAENFLLFNGFAISELFTDAPVDLAGERGCRLHFRATYQTEAFFDYLLAGAADASKINLDVLTGESDWNFFTGESLNFPDTFWAEEASISDLDGEQAHPLFAMLSDESIEHDGAYVDNLRLICRDQTYVNGIASGAEYDQPNVGNYIRFSGTSMATPHVAGVVALVRDAAPGATLEEVVDAVLAGVRPLPSLEGKTVTGGTADAFLAIKVALGEEEEDEPSLSDDSSGAGAPPPAVPPPPIATPDRVAPHTFIRKRPRKVVFTPWRRGRAVFKFRSNEAGVLFFCQFDRKRWRRCGPRFVRWFLPGGHVLRVKARDAAGNVDPTPAVHRFRVRRVSKQQFARLKRASRRARHDRR